MSTLSVSQTDDHITTITLNRPQQHNAFDDELILALTETLKDLEQDQQTHVIILAATGKSFCAGADLAWMQKMVNYTLAENIADSERLATCLKTLYELKKPTIACVQGSAFGGGAGLIACCDHAIAVDQAQFCLSEVKLGLIPAVISPYVIAAMGPRLALQAFQTADVFSAEQALQWHLISAVVSADQLTTKTLDLAQKLQALDPAALVACKRLVRDVTGQALDQQLLQDTAKRIAALRISENAQTKLKAFLQKSNRTT